MATAKAEWKDLAIQAGSVFTPSSPIDGVTLFAGRVEQVRVIVDVINQKGQHGVLYGERGVGKTSLANVLSSFLRNPNKPILAPRVNCDSTDTFDSVWRKVFDQITLSRQKLPPGFNKAPTPVPVPIVPDKSEEMVPDSVRRTLAILAQNAMPILIIDEFDRLNADARRAFADTIKTLSDHSVGATILMVGVADGVEQLIEAHQSIGRALVQVPMPRMSLIEIDGILAKGVSALNMSIAKQAAARISKLSQGLPHYAHLLGLHSSRVALDRESASISSSDVDIAVKKAITGAQQSIRSAYDLAIRSPRKDSLFADVLLSCALADANELGFFAAQDVRGPMCRITGKKYEIPSFAQHLNEFCDEKRGNVLHKDGVRRRFRYRFSDPLLQPFVIMRGLDTQRITPDFLD